MINCWILAVFEDRRRNWVCMGQDRDEAEYRYRNDLADGQFERPAYRLVIHRKAA